MPTTTPNAYPGTPGTTLYAGLPSPPSATLRTTRTLSNTSGGTQATNFVTPMFGLPLKEGDMPAGQFPEFRLTDNTPVPATVYNMAAWADGSMNMCGVIARVPSSVAGSGSLTVNVYSGGTAPAASSRTLAEVTAGSDIKIEYTGTTNLSGLWTASLNDAITNDGNIIVIGDGPAGKVWRIGGHFKQAGSPHGQLYCWHYIAVLQNAAGGLLGVRYLGVWGQIFADVASPAPTHRTGTAALMNGATLVRQLQGVASTPAISTNDGVVSSTIHIPHFSRASTAGPDATWDYFQCGGTGAADCTIRVIQDTVYVQKTKLTPVFPTGLTVPDVVAKDYAINAKGNHAEYAMGAPGERAEIGIMPEWCAKYLASPSAANERAVRVNAMCALGWAAETRPAAEKKPAAVNTVGTFTGVPSKPTWSLDQRTGGIINPTGNLNIWGLDTAHRPAASYTAYLMTGEPQILDTMIGHACGHLQLTNTGYVIYLAARPIPGPFPTGAFAGVRGMRIDDAGETYDSCGLLMKTGGIRQGAWAFRDIASAYAMTPASYPDGDYKGFLGYLVDNAFRGFNAFCAANPTAWQNDGMFVYGGRSATQGEGEGLFMVNYLDMSFCFISALTQNARAIQARQYLGRRFNAIASRYNIGCMGCYDYQVWKDNAITENYGEVVWGLGASVKSLNFSVATNNVTVGAATIGANWEFTNGDVFCFTSNVTGAGTRPYDEMVSQKRFYVVNASGNTFQLSDTLGGAPLTVVRNLNMTSGNYYANIQDRTIGIEAGGTGGLQGYQLMSASAMNYHHLLGDDVSVARTELQAHLAYEGLNYATNPKYRFLDTFPA